jgi:glycosyltransferase involved in cell wall biosynthesis
MIDASFETRHAVVAGGPGPDALTVAYILKMFPRFSETFILNEILELERRGVKVVVFSMKQPDERMRQPSVGQVKARVYIVPPLRGHLARSHVVAHLGCLVRRPIRYLRTLWFVLGRRTDAAWSKFLCAPFIVRTSRAEGVEHLHAHFASGPARQAKLTSLLSGIPFSFTAHAKDLFWNGHQHGKNNKLKKRVRLASFVVTISDFNRDFILRQGFKVPRRRLATIYNGLDLGEWPFMRPDGRPRPSRSDRRLAAPADDGPFLLAVGRLVPKKGFDVLIAACRVLRERGVEARCVIAGEGPERARLEGLIDQHDLCGRVALVGPVPQDGLIAELYPRATALIQPSIVGSDGDQDGIPTVILEALAIGLPVVASSVSGIGEAVIDGETGLLVPPDDADALAAAIIRLLRSPDLAHRIAAGGRRFAEMRFDIKNNVKLLVHLMITSARGGPRWSDRKLRERVGLASLEETVEEAP